MERIPTMHIPYRDRVATVRAAFDNRPDGEVWSTDFSRLQGEELINHLAHPLQFNTHYPDFPALSDPHAVNVPGAEQRTVAALVAAVREMGLDVHADRRRGRTPLYGMGGAYAVAGLVDLRGVTLSLVDAYTAKGIRPPSEFVYAVSRITASGTHCGACTFLFAKALEETEGSR